MKVVVPVNCAADSSGAGLPEFRCAVVSDGTVATRYRLAGAGAPVVVLWDATTPMEPSLLSRLAARRRVIVPDVAAARTSRAFSVWLRGFLDGLGLVEVAVVASPAYALAVLGFTLVECARVSRLVLLQRDAADPVAPVCAIRDDLDGIARPLLLVRVDEAEPAAAELVDAVVQFLTSGA